MHSLDTINQLIELRAEGKSCRTIAAELNISLGAAHKLAQDHDEEIQQLAFLRREALRERYLNSFEGKLSDLAGELQRIDEELKLRDLATVSTEFLLYRKTCLQARQEKLAHEPVSKSVPPIAANKNEHS
jgi:hypothetical protein